MCSSAIEGDHIRIKLTKTACQILDKITVQVLSKYLRHTFNWHCVLDCVPGHSDRPPHCLPSQIPLYNTQQSGWLYPICILISLLKYPKSVQICLLNISTLAHLFEYVLKYPNKYSALDTSIWKLLYTFITTLGNDACK